MGAIRIGRMNPTRVDSANITKMANANHSAPSASEKSLSEEDKAKLIENIKALPKDKWVSALRSAGLEKEADECEKSLAEEHIHEMKVAARNQRLAEIKALDEDEQLPLLLEEGFDDEAKALSEKLSAITGGESGGGGGTEDNDGASGDGEKQILDSDGGSEDKTVKPKTAKKEPKPKTTAKKGAKKGKNV